LCSAVPLWKKVANLAFICLDLSICFYLKTGVFYSASLPWRRGVSFVFLLGRVTVLSALYDAVAFLVQMIYDPVFLLRKMQSSMLTPSKNIQYTQVYNEMNNKISQTFPYCEKGNLLRELYLQKLSLAISKNGGNLANPEIEELVSDLLKNLFFAAYLQLKQISENTIAPTAEAMQPIIQFATFYHAFHRGDLIVNEEKQWHTAISTATDESHFKKFYNEESQPHFEINQLFNCIADLFEQTKKSFPSITTLINQDLLKKDTNIQNNKTESLNFTPTQFPLPQLQLSKPLAEIENSLTPEARKEKIGQFQKDNYASILPALEFMEKVSESVCEGLKDIITLSQVHGLGQKETNDFLLDGKRCYVLAPFAQFSAVYHAFRERAGTNVDLFYQLGTERFKMRELYNKTCELFAKLFPGHGLLEKSNFKPDLTKETYNPLPKKNASPQSIAASTVLSPSKAPSSSASAPQNSSPQTPPSPISPNTLPENLKSLINDVNAQTKDLDVLRAGVRNIINSINPSSNSSTSTLSPQLTSSPVVSGLASATASSSSSTLSTTTTSSTSQTPLPNPMVALPDHLKILMTEINSDLAPFANAFPDVEIKPSIALELHEIKTQVLLYKKAASSQPITFEHRELESLVYTILQIVFKSTVNQLERGLPTDEPFWKRVQFFTQIYHSFRQAATIQCKDKKLIIAPSKNRVLGHELLFYKENTLHQKANHLFNSYIDLLTLFQNHSTRVQELLKKPSFHKDMAYDSYNHLPIDEFVIEIPKPHLKKPLSGKTILPIFPFCKKILDQINGSVNIIENYNEETLKSFTVAFKALSTYATDAIKQLLVIAEVHDLDADATAALINRRDDCFILDFLDHLCLAYHRLRQAAKKDDRPSLHTGIDGKQVLPNLAAPKKIPKKHSKRFYQENTTCCQIRSYYNAPLELLEKKLPQAHPFWDLTFYKKDTSADSYPLIEDILLFILSGGVVVLSKKT
jgi:hypothetical protein